MSDLGGEAGGADAAGEGEYVTHRAGLQCVLKPRPPSTHRDGSLNHLKHILDSVPFTPSQGVRTPSPRHCMDASQGNPFFSDVVSSPPAMHPNRCVSPEPSWNVGVIAKHDAPVRELPQHNSPLARRYREAALCGQALQTPRSQSQASTQSGSPHKVAQPDMCGASAAAHMHPVWHDRQPHGNEQGHMPLVHVPGQGVGQGMYPPEDYRAPAYEMPMPHGMYGVPTDLAPLHVRPHQPFPHQLPPAGLAAMPSVPDVRQPSMTRTVNTNARGQVSPQRTQGKQVKKEGSNRQQFSSPQPDNRAQPGRKSMDSGAVKVAANAGQPFSSYYKDSDAVSSLSTDSPGPDSPNQVAKSKIEVKLSSTGQLMFNARQRRTLRRALQRERRVAIPDGKDFTLEALEEEPISQDERAVVVDVVQSHIGCPLPEGTDLDELMKVLLHLGVAEPEVVSEAVQEEQLADLADQPSDPTAEPNNPTVPPPIL